MIILLWTTSTLSNWYGTYPVGDLGVFVTNHAKAKMFQARKLSQELKPSAYNQKVHVTIW